VVGNVEALFCGVGNLFTRARNRLTHYSLQVGQIDALVVFDVASAFNLRIEE
jgi:hypothetical protein